MLITGIHPLSLSLSLSTSSLYTTRVLSTKEREEGIPLSLSGFIVPRPFPTLFQRRPTFRQLQFDGEKRSDSG